MQEKQENQENREKKAAGRISGKLPVAKLTRDNFLIVILVGVLLLVIAWPVEEKYVQTPKRRGLFRMRSLACFPIRPPSNIPWKSFCQRWTA